MRQYLDLTTWIVLFALLPVTVLILLSQNTIPGDLFYPIKRSMENVILAAASVSPSTKVAFRTDLTQRRFSEAQQLLVSKGDTAAYNDFVTEVSSAQLDSSALSNPKDKLESSDKLIAKIDEYQTQLTQVQNQVQIAQATQPGQQTQPTSTPLTSFNPQQSPLQTAVPQPETPKQSPIEQISPTPSATSPTSTPATLTQNVATTIANNPQKAEEAIKKISDTKVDLEKIREKLNKDREDAEFKQKVRAEEEKSKGESNRSKEGKSEPTASPSNNQ